MNTSPRPYFNMRMQMVEILSRLLNVRVGRTALIRIMNHALTQYALWAGGTGQLIGRLTDDEIDIAM